MHVCLFSERRRNIFPKVQFLMFMNSLHGVHSRAIPENVPPGGSMGPRVFSSDESLKESLQRNCGVVPGRTANRRLENYAQVKPENRKVGSIFIASVSISQNLIFFQAIFIYPNASLGISSFACKFLSRQSWQQIKRPRQEMAIGYLWPLRGALLPN